MNKCDKCKYWSGVHCKFECVDHREFTPTALPRRAEPEPSVLAKAVSGRALMHIPIGAVTAMCICRPMAAILKGRVLPEIGGWVLIAGIAMSTLLTIGFLIYEIAEHKRISDGADRDIFGWLEGVLGVIALYWNVFMV